MNRFSLTWCVGIFALLLTSVRAADSDGKTELVSGLVRTLGYGGAIHNFKNYVLRGDEKYYTASQATFEQANQILAKLDRAQGMTPEERSALATVTEVVKAYHAHLPTIKKLRKQGKSVEEIDEAVSVDDTSAIKAMDTLRARHSWSEIQNLEFHIGYGSGIHNFKNFVLRADEQYHARSTLGLSNALLVVARYRTSEGLTKAQLDALDKIESVMRAYEVALLKVHELIGEGKTAQQIDEVVKVNDAPALEGLATLRK